MLGKEIKVTEIKDLQGTFNKRRDVACNIPSFITYFRAFGNRL